MRKLTDTPSIVARINLWATVNIRVFKLKLNNALTYFISSLENLKIKEIKLLYKDMTSEQFYLLSFAYLSVVVFVLYFFV